jgi:mersacidin/lichenicidin family type 2 lantibiotic
MNHEQIIRAWKDSSYRSSLSAEELAQMPGNPAGEILSEVELNSVVGGDSSYNVFAYQTGSVCSPVSAQRSSTVFNNVSNTGTISISSDCSNNSYTDNSTNYYGY